MERRTAIKQLVIVAGGLALLPSCLRDKGKASIQLANIDVDAIGEGVLAEIVETLIPETDTPGGKTLNLHLFVLKMVDDCHDEKDQALFVDGLRQWDITMRSTSGMRFGESDESQRTAFLGSIASDNQHPLAGFYQIVKRRTIQGYLNSEYVMTNQLVYELIPARYDGYSKA